MNGDLSKGPVVKSMLLFAIPMILGDLLQQCYNIADTLIVGRCLGEKALAAVGSSFTLMTFITSIILGLCMGSSALVSIRFGQKDENGLKEDISASFRRAYKFLKAAEPIYFDIEEKYSNSMNFGKVNLLVDEFIEKLFKKTSNSGQYKKERHLFGTAITPIGHID